MTAAHISSKFWTYTRHQQDYRSPEKEDINAYSGEEEGINVNITTIEMSSQSQMIGDRVKSPRSLGGNEQKGV